jgi:hypothetical protein
MENRIVATDPDLTRKVEDLIRAHAEQFPETTRSTFYVCTRCGLLYQSMYGCGCQEGS